MSKRKGRPTPKRVWDPMKPVPFVPWTPEKRAETLKLLAAEYEPVGDMTAEQYMDAYIDPSRQEGWQNDRYLACVDRDKDGDVDHISFRRNDRGTIHDWRDIQRIKNDIAGEEVEAIELYPAESRVVDTANQYHLWVMKPGVVLPLGFPKGKIINEPEPITGAVQRPR